LAPSRCLGRSPFCRAGMRHRRIPAASRSPFCRAGVPTPAGPSCPPDRRGGLPCLSAEASAKAEAQSNGNLGAVFASGLRVASVALGASGALLFTLPVPPAPFTPSEAEGSVVEGSAVEGPKPPLPPPALPLAFSRWAGACLLPRGRSVGRVCDGGDCPPAVRRYDPSSPPLPAPLYETTAAKTGLVLALGQYLQAAGHGAHP